MLALAFAAVLPATAQLQPARTIILIGPPGSGKTVQAEALHKAYKIPSVSMTELLRREMNRKSPLGKVLEKSQDADVFLSDEAANDLMKARFLRGDASRGFILDGYPATEGQARAFDQYLSEHNLPKPSVVVLNVPEEVSRERLTRRGRTGDDRSNIERRLANYKDVGLLVERWYGSERVVRVDGTGSPSDVTLRITKGIEDLPSELKRR